MIKKIIFLISWPLSLRDYHRFGTEVLKENGFEVYYFDFTPFMNPLLQKTATVPDPVHFKDIKIFYSEKEALRAILSLTPDCFVILLDRYNRRTYSIYRSLSRVKARYAVIVTNAIPYSFQGSSKFAYLLKKARSLTLPRLSRFLLNFPFRPIFYKYLGIQEPSFWLAGGTKSLDIYFTSFPFGKRTEILWLHTMDYDIFLEDSKSQNQNEERYNTAVFLDAGGIRFSADGSGIPTLTEKKYYPSLCHFFDKVESEQGVRVEIAAHPRTTHESNPDYFGKRFTVRGKTAQMIKESKFVITHASTAISFAVLFNKPVIFITTDEYKANSDEEHHIKVMASWLGKYPVNIDRQDGLNWDKELAIDREKYAEYKHCFIKKSGTEDLNSWQIFSNALKCI